MSKIYKHVANATGEMDHLLERIDNAFERAVEIVGKTIVADEVDAVFINAPGLAIPELGVGGHCNGPNNIEIHLNPKFDVAENEIVCHLLHELHHAMRLRQVKNYHKTLGGAFIAEGLACYFETEQARDEPPIYCQVELPNERVAEAKKHLSDEKYDYFKWIKGDGNVPHWFGYTYGYKLVKDYAEANNLKSEDMLYTEPEEILKTA